MVKLRRLNKSDRCPVCGHDDWCYYINEHTVVCMRVPSSVPKRSKKGYGGYIHELDGTNDNGNTEFFQPPTAERTDPSTIDRTYRAFLARTELQLTLTDYKTFKEKWELSADFVKSHGYRRLPLMGRARICRELLADGYHLAGVPGFYNNGDYWTFACGPGLIFPVLSGKICGLQVRLDDSQDRRKYVWFSSARHGGVSSGAPFHVAVPAKIKHPSVIITEGIKKADVVAHYMGAVCIGSPGVGAFGGIPDFVAELNRKHAPVIVAYDNDIMEKHEVFEAFNALISSLSGEVYVAVWSSKYKGIDDLLVSGGRPKIIPVKIFASSLQASWDEKAKA